MSWCLICTTPVLEILRLSGGTTELLSCQYTLTWILGWMLKTCAELWPAGSAGTCPWGAGHCHQEWSIEPQIMGGIFQLWPLLGGGWKTTPMNSLLEWTFWLWLGKEGGKVLVLSGLLPLRNFSQFRRLPSKVVRFVSSPRERNVAFKDLLRFVNWCLGLLCYDHALQEQYSQHMW